MEPSSRPRAIALPSGRQQRHEIHFPNQEATYISKFEINKGRIRIQL